MQTNRSTFDILFYLNTSQAKKSGKCPIVGRITVDGKSATFSTRFDALPEQCDAKSGLVTGQSKETKDINRQIEKYRTTIANHYKDMVNDNGYATAEALKNVLRGIGLNRNTVMQEFNELVEEKRKSVGTRIVASSYCIYPAAYRCFKTFLRSKYDADDIPFRKVDMALIEEYARFLKIDLRLAPRTAKATMKPFRTVVKRAFNKGLIYGDPFLAYVPEKIMRNPRWLSNDEIDRLMKVELKSAAKSFVRDIFIFCTFTGISFIDLKNLEHGNIHTMDDGSRWIILNRKKTGTASYIPLLPVPESILNKYVNTKFAGTGGKVFKIRSSASVNGHLKELATLAQIDKCLKFHMSRHSFGTSICLSQGVPIETLSRMMGHLSIKTTQIYAEVTSTKINEDMTKLEKLIKGKYELAGMANITKTPKTRRKRG